MPDRTVRRRDVGYRSGRQTDGKVVKSVEPFTRLDYGHLGDGRFSGQLEVGQAAEIRPVPGQPSPAACSIRTGRSHSRHFK